MIEKPNRPVGVKSICFTEYVGHLCGNRSAFKYLIQKYINQIKIKRFQPTMDPRETALLVFLVVGRAGSDLDLTSKR